MNVEVDNDPAEIEKIRKAVVYAMPGKKTPMSDNAG